MKFIVAIDGTAASGKGTLAKKTANHFGFKYLDTGILYRVVAYHLKSSGINSEISKQNVQDSLKLLFNKDFQLSHLRNEEISLKASIISKNKIVRDNLLSYQREFAMQEGGTVLDGRDIGTVVCPNADIKIFVDADIDIRAKRRYDQYLKKNSNLNLSDIIDDLTKRDYIDKNRQLSPLVSAKDAFLLDTSNITSDDGLKKIIQIISRKLEK
jgi:cytidylate kinase